MYIIGTQMQPEQGRSPTSSSFLLFFLVVYLIQVKGEPR